MIQAFALPSALISDKVKSLFAGTANENCAKFWTLTFRLVVCLGGGGEASTGVSVGDGTGLAVSVGGTGVSVDDGTALAVSVGGTGVDVELGISVGGADVAVFSNVVLVTSITLGTCVAT